MVMIKYLISMLLLFVVSGVLSQSRQKDILFEKENYHFQYDVNHADKVWKMPDELKEISALTFLSDHLLATVQDEKGIVYIYNTIKEKVVKKIKFTGAGDFEGLEKVKDDIWVLRSDGKLYRVMDYKEKEPKIKKYETGFSERNNTEGLGFDYATQKLLIACKGYPFPKVEKRWEAKEFKSVYSFDLKEKKLDNDPFLLIALDSIKEHSDYNTLTRWGIELLAYFDEAEGDVSFQPSGVAVHPQSGNLYLLASVGKILAVFSPKGVMLSLVELDKNVHLQPEGICFSPDGTLYISNEGHDHKGKVYRFDKVKR
jgi:uncharacterized protein YjiK